MNKVVKHQKIKDDSKYLNDVFAIEAFAILIAVLVIFSMLYFLLIYQIAIKQSSNLNAGNYTKNLGTLNSSYGKVIIGNYILINSSLFSCNMNNECSVVPITICQNNLPNQVTCINSRYYQEYMNYYQELKDHTPVMCPMFIVSGYTTCSCVHNTCVAVYHNSSVRSLNP